MPEKKMVEIEINGKIYRIASQYDKAYMNKISTYLNEKLTSAMKGSRNRSLQQALILVSLDIVDELFQFRQKCDTERTILKGAVKELMQEVNDTLEQIKP